MSGTPTSSKSKVDKIIVGSGRNNLFHTLLLFLHHVKQVWSLIQQILHIWHNIKKLRAMLLVTSKFVTLSREGKKLKKILLKGPDG